MSLLQLRQTLVDTDQNLGDILLGIGTGVLASPASDDGRERWYWFADLFTHPVWGASSVNPAVEGICDRVSRLCEITANPVGPLDLSDRWVTEQATAQALLGIYTPHTDGTWEVAQAAVDISTDGIDYCAGQSVSGVESTVCAFTAITLTQDAAQARRTITAAVDSWINPKPLDLAALARTA